MGMDWRKWGRRPSTLVAAFFGLGVCAGVASVVLWSDSDAPNVADPHEVELAETSPAVAQADVSLAPPIHPAVLIPAAPAPIV